MFNQETRRAPIAYILHHEVQHGERRGILDDRKNRIDRKWYSFTSAKRQIRGASQEILVDLLCHLRTSCSYNRATYVCSIPLLGL